MVAFEAEGLLRWQNDDGAASSGIVHSMFDAVQASNDIVVGISWSSFAALDVKRKSTSFTVLGRDFDLAAL